MLDKTHRTDMLRDVFPAGITSLEDVRKKLQSKPDLVARRPQHGWQTPGMPFLSQKVLPIEQQTQQSVQLVERYMKWDPRSSLDFYSLCNLWFYYDANDNVVDVEWEWRSD